MSDTPIFATIPHALIERPYRSEGMVDAENRLVDPVDEISEILLRNLERPYLSANLLVWVDALLDAGDPLGDVFCAWRAREPYALVIDGERFYVFGPSRVAAYVADPPARLPLHRDQLVAVCGNIPPSLYLQHGFFGREWYSREWPTFDFCGPAPDRPLLVTWYEPALEVYVALYTTRPDGTPVEVDYPGYARVRAEFRGGALATRIQWPTVTRATVVTHLGLVDAEGRPFEPIEGFPFLPSRMHNTPLVLGAGDHYEAAPGAITMRFE